MKYDEIKTNMEKAFNDFQKERKEALLKKYGLYHEEKVSPSEAKDIEGVHKRIDSETNQTVYYKIIYEDVSFEELSYLESIDLSNHVNNRLKSMSLIFTILGTVITALGLLLGLNFALAGDNGFGIVFIIVGVLMASLFFGLAEVIKALNKLN